MSRLALSKSGVFVWLTSDQVLSFLEIVSNHFIEMSRIANKEVIFCYFNSRSRVLISQNCTNKKISFLGSLVSIPGSVDQHRAPTELFRFSEFCKKKENYRLEHSATTPHNEYSYFLLYCINVFWNLDKVYHEGVIRILFFRLPWEIQEVIF